jgi:hypothetical protein
VPKPTESAVNESSSSMMSNIRLICSVLGPGLISPEEVAFTVVKMGVSATAGAAVGATAVVIEAVAPSAVEAVGSSLALIPEHVVDSVKAIAKKAIGPETLLAAKAGVIGGALMMEDVCSVVNDAVDWLTPKGDIMGKEETVVENKGTWVESIYFWGNLGAKAALSATPGPALMCAAPHVANWLERSTGIPYIGKVTQCTMHGIGLATDPVGYSISYGASMAASYATNLALDKMGVESPEARALINLGTNIVACQVTRPENIQALKTSAKEHIPQNVATKIDAGIAKVEKIVHKQERRVEKFVKRNIDAKTRQQIQGLANNAIDAVEEISDKVCEIHEEAKELVDTKLLDSSIVHSIGENLESSKNTISKHTSQPIKKAARFFTHHFNQQFQHAAAGELCRRQIFQPNEDEMTALLIASTMAGTVGFFRGAIKQAMALQQASQKIETTPPLAPPNAHAPARLFQLNKVPFALQDPLTKLPPVKMEFLPLEADDRFQLSLPANI